MSQGTDLGKKPPTKEMWASAALEVNHAVGGSLEEERAMSVLK